MSRGQELVTMDFLGIDQSREKTSEIKYCTPDLNEKSIHWIKPQMVQQVFSCRGLGEEYCKAPKVSRGSEDPKFEAASRFMKELFPESTGGGSNPTAEQNIATSGNSSIGRSVNTTPPGKQSAAQLTIFYNGTVNVYDLFEKQAEDIIRFASDEIRSPKLHSFGFDSHAPAKPITISSTITTTSNHTEEPLRSNPSKKCNPQQLLIQKLNTDLPQQRKLSLQRFLQNRKEYRMNRVAPYSQCHTQSLPKKTVNLGPEYGSAPLP